jgi:spore germination protein GerM
VNRRFTITALIAILVGIAVVGYLNRHQDNSSATPELTTIPSGLSENDIKTSVHVYYADNNIEYLVAEERSITVPNNPVAKGKAIIGLLIRGPKGKLVQTLPASTTLRDFYLTPKGVAVVDFNNVTTDYPGGAQMELMTLYAIVNSLVLNIDKINAVKILITGREATTLTGHLDIRSPYKANMLLVK